jgi:hypothetical protein
MNPIGRSAWPINPAVRQKNGNALERGKGELEIE